MKTRSYKSRKHLDFLILDELCIALCYWAAVYLRHGSLHLGSRMGLFFDIWLFLAVSDGIITVLANVHHNILKREAWSEIKSVVGLGLVLWALLGFYAFITQKGTEFSRNVYLMSLILTLFVLLAARLAYKIYLRRRLSANVKQPEMLLITTRYRASGLIEKFRERPYHSFHLDGIALLGGGSTEKEVDGIPVRCTESTLEQYLLSHVVDEVMLSLPYDYPGREEIIHEIIRSGVRLHINLEYNYEDLPHKYLENIDGYTVLTSWVTDIDPLQAAGKRALDIVGSIVGLLLTGIACIFVAPAIYKASPGPIFFTQERVGMNGRRFRMVKFRSMYMDAEERKKELMAQNEVADGMMFKMENDPRIIGSEKGPGKGIGNFIRKTSIDELPQFWNVLKGYSAIIRTTKKSLDLQGILQPMRASELCF